MDYLHPCVSLMLRLPTHAQKNENASQNDTVRHRKIPYGTVRNRTKVRKWPKKTRKLQEKKYERILRMFIQFFALFPWCLQVKMLQSTPLSLDLTFQSLPNYSAQITLRILAFFCWPKHSASPSNDLCIRLHSKGSDTAANLTFVIL